MKKLILSSLVGIVGVTFIFIMYGIVSWHAFARPTFFSKELTCCTSTGEFYVSLFGYDCFCGGLKVFPMPQVVPEMKPE